METYRLITSDGRGIAIRTWSLGIAVREAMRVAREMAAEAGEELTVRLEDSGGFTWAKWIETGEEFECAM